MTIIIAGTFTIDAAKHDAYLDAALEMTAATLEEPGCMAYVFSPDARDPRVLHLFEKWASLADLRSHGTSDHMAAWQARVEELGGMERDISLYNVTSEKPL